MQTRHAVTRASICLALILLAGCFTPLAAATIENVPAGPVATLYLVGAGEPMTATITVQAPADSPPPLLLLRAFDADEHLTAWRYVEYVTPEVLEAVEPAEGMDIRPREDWQGGPVVSLEVPLEAEGVHQVRLVSGTGGVSVSVETPQAVQWGWSAQNGPFRPWEGLPETLYAWVPPHAEQLRIKGGPVLVSTEGSDLLARAESGMTTIPVDETEQIWHFQMPDENWSFSAADFPLILCPTPEAARAIEASVEVLEDGTVVCHKFQRRIAELLPEILAPERVGDTEELIVPLAERREAWLQDPMRSLVLMGSYLPAVEHYLRSQNLDPNSHWSGSIEGWEAFADKEGREGRWDRLHGIDGLPAGASSNPHHSGTRDLALAALEDDPTNPYFGREELLYRAAAGCLRDLMVVAEDETWPGTADLDTYPGMMAFKLGGKTLPPSGGPRRICPRRSARSGRRRSGTLWTAPTPTASSHAAISPPTTSSATRPSPMVPASRCTMRWRACISAAGAPVSHRPVITWKPPARMPAISG